MSKFERVTIVITWSKVWEDKYKWFDSVYEKVDPDGPDWKINWHFHPSKTSMVWCLLKGHFFRSLCWSGRLLKKLILYILHSSLVGSLLIIATMLYQN